MLLDFGFDYFKLFIFVVATCECIQTNINTCPGQTIGVLWVGVGRRGYTERGCPEAGEEPCVYTTICSGLALFPYSVF